MFRTTFYGQEISDYGRTYGRVDYSALAKSFDAVLCNSILGYRESWDEWEQIHGFCDNSEEIEQKKEELEEVTEALEKAEEAKEEGESNLEDYNRASENIAELLQRFDNFEYESNELLECVNWNDFETPAGDDFDTDIIENNVNYLDLWGMREAIEAYQSKVDEAREDAEAEFEELEAEVDKLTKRSEELEEAIEELEEEDLTETEFYQYYIISDSGYQILSENTNEAVWYNAELDLYVWGVTHWGTSWDYVLTSIPCETYEQAEERERAEAEAEAERKARAEAMTAEERAEKEAEDLEDLLALWDGDEADPLDYENGNDLEAWVESLSRESEPTTKKGLTDWSDLDNLNDAVYMVVGNEDASEAYGITVNGWRGEVESIDRDSEGNIISFDALGIGNDSTEYIYNPNIEYFNLEPKFFDLYRVERTEGGEE